MIPDLGKHISSKITKMEGVEVSVTGECIGCGSCIESCFIDAVELVDGKASISDECRGCGRCVEACPQNAITISIDPTAYETAINRIDSSLDLS